MTDVNIYYSRDNRYQHTLQQNGVDIDAVVSEGDKTIVDIHTEVKADKQFCRNEESINYNYMLSQIYSNVVLYAEIDGRVAGVLCFMFNYRPGGERLFNFNGICSPTQYARRGVGERLIRTLINIAKVSNIQSIYLECMESLVKYYNRFGFHSTRVSKTYESDDSDDSDDEGEAHYYMKLDVSSVVGGKLRRNSRRRINTNYRKKKKRITRKRKLRKN